MRAMDIDGPGQPSQKTCPSCGRTMKGSHTLCVKCGAKLDNPAPLTGPAARITIWTRQRVIATAIVVAVLTTLALLIWIFTDGDQKPTRRPGRSARAPHGATDGQATSSAPGPRAKAADAGAHIPAPAPTPGTTRPSPGSIGLPPPRSGQRADAGARAQPPPHPHPVPLPMGPSRGFVADLRRCVDAERQSAASDCASIRRYLGHTAESACLWSKIFARYWTCLKKKVKRAGKCLKGCATTGSSCIAGCVGKTERRTGEPTGACLFRCWRERIDPCLGKCTRP